MLTILDLKEKYNYGNHEESDFQEEPEGQRNIDKFVNFVKTIPQKFESEEAISQVIGTVAKGAEIAI